MTTGKTKTKGSSTIPELLATAMKKHPALGDTEKEAEASRRRIDIVETKEYGVRAAANTEYLRRDLLLLQESETVPKGKLQQWQRSKPLGYDLTDRQIRTCLKTARTYQEAVEQEVTLPAADMRRSYESLHATFKCRINGTDPDEEVEPKPPPTHDEEVKKRSEHIGKLLNRLAEDGETSDLEMWANFSANWVTELRSATARAVEVDVPELADTDRWEVVTAITSHKASGQKKATRNLSWDGSPARYIYGSGRRDVLPGSVLLRRVEGDDIEIWQLVAKKEAPTLVRIGGSYSERPAAAKTKLLDAVAVALQGPGTSQAKPASKPKAKPNPKQQPKTGARSTVVGKCDDVAKAAPGRVDCGIQTPALTLVPGGRGDSTTTTSLPPEDEVRDASVTHLTDCQKQHHDDPVPDFEEMNQPKSPEEMGRMMSIWIRRKVGSDRRDVGAGATASEIPIKPNVAWRRQLVHLLCRLHGCETRDSGKTVVASGDMPVIEETTRLLLETDRIIKQYCDGRIRQLKESGRWAGLTRGQRNSSRREHSEKIVQILERHLSVGEAEFRNGT